MERETGIEPALVAWKATVLPLNYSRAARNPVLAWRDWWREVDSNHRRRKPADLQSAPVGRLGIPPVVAQTRETARYFDEGMGPCQRADVAAGSMAALPGFGPRAGMLAFGRTVQEVVRVGVAFLNGALSRASTLPTLSRPARRSAPGVRMTCAAMPRKQALLTPHAETDPSCGGPGHSPLPSPPLEGEGK